MVGMYVTPETEILREEVQQVLCQSQPLQSGTVEKVDRMEFDW